MPIAERTVASKQRRPVKRPVLARLVSAINLGSKGRRQPGRMRAALALGAKWAGLYIAVAVLVFAASWTRFPNVLLGCVDYAERGYLSLIDYVTVPPPIGDLKIILIDDKTVADSAQIPHMRKRHARLLEALTGVGARVVAFDITFASDGGPDSDSPLANAIRASGATHVVLGAKPASDSFRSPLPVSPRLASVLKPGQLASASVGDAGTALFNPILRRYVRLAGASDSTGPVSDTRPTFPLQVKLAWETARLGRPVVARIDLARGQIGVWDGTTKVDAIPCAVLLRQEGNGYEQHANVLFRRLGPAALDDVTVSYTEFEEWIDDDRRASNLREYQNKVVLIGSKVGDYTLQLPNEKVYGYAIHASVINDLLEKVHPRDPGVSGQLALLCVVALLAGLSRLAFPRGDWPLPISLWGWKVNCPITLLALFGVFVLASVYVYTHMQMVLDVTYGTVAMVAGYYVPNSFLLDNTSKSRSHRKKGVAGARS